MSAIKTETILIVGGGLVAGVVLWKLFGAGAKAVGGVLSGNNGLTLGAVDWSGTPTTAYQGAGVLGTAGAAANVASGGLFASMGDWLGSTIFDATHSAPSMASAPLNPAPASTSAATDKYTQGGNAASGSGSLDMFSDPEGYGAMWGN